MSRVLYLLLAVVALAAVVLSFDALHGLAMLCGFTPALAPLLPVTIDAGAAAGSLVWLSRPPGTARRFGRVLALVLLASSVVGNALGHGLVAYSTRPAWWVVVAVSAVPPAVLAAVIHLGVLAARNNVPASAESAEPTESATGSETIGIFAVQGRPGSREQVRDSVTQQAVRIQNGSDRNPDEQDRGSTSASAESAEPAESGRGPSGAAELIAAGAGRRRLSRELDISEYAARELLAAHRANTTAVAQ